MIDISQRDINFSAHLQDARSCRDNMVRIVQLIEDLKGRVQDKLNIGIPGDAAITEDDRTALLAQYTRLRDIFIANLNEQIGN